MKWSIFGSSGFIGSAFKRFLNDKNQEVVTIDRNHSTIGSASHLGIGVYCIGMTADFRSQPFETIEAHVCKLKEVLSTYTFDKFLYLSSTRVYMHAQSGKEGTFLQVDPSQLDNLYNISKLMGESMVHAAGGIVLRISNVYGPDFHSNNFLSSIIRSAISKGSITLDLHPDSSKDFISLNEVLQLLYAVGHGNQYDTYNIASGTNTSLGTIVECVSKHTNSNFFTNTNGLLVNFPKINTDRIQFEFNHKSLSILNNIKNIVDFYKN